MMTIMYPNYEQYPKYENYENYDQDQNDWGFFVNLDDLYDHQLSKNNKYNDNYKKQQKRINYMSSIKEVDRNMDIDMVDDEEFGWYVPDKRPNKPQNKFEQRDMDIRTDKRTKININIEYDYDDKNEVMKSCLNTCIVLGISIGCSIFIVLFYTIEDLKWDKIPK